MTIQDATNVTASFTLVILYLLLLIVMIKKTYEDISKEYLNSENRRLKKLARILENILLKVMKDG